MSAAVAEEAQRHYHLGRALLHAERLPEALQAYREAFSRDPEGLLDRRECLDRFRGLQINSLPAFWRAELLRFFRRDDVDKSRYAASGLSALMASPAFRTVWASMPGQDGRFQPPAEALDEVMRDELFGLLLRDALIAQPELEVVLTKVRAAVLLDEPLRARAPLDFLCDLAMQCFNNELVFAEAAEESAALAGLELDIDSLRRHGTEEHARALAVLGMYRPLLRVPGVASLLAAPALPEALRRLLRRAVANVLEEQRLKSQIPIMGPVTDAVSRAVRSQYEENPYPRWLSFDRLPRLPAADWLAAEVPGIGARAASSEPLRMLVVGCGTGVETLGLATWVTGLRVTAIDLSLASLAYAQRMADELGRGGVEFRQADLLELPEPAQRFDLVYCVGVLMALRDPEAGLRALLRQLRPGGLLKLGLYSSRAREAINIARGIIARERIPATPIAMRAFRQRVFRAAPDDPLRSLLRWRDFYAMSDCRDMLFHVQEHQFTLPQIEALLKQHGLTVLGMSRQLPRHALLAYRAIFWGEPDMTDLSRWEAVEARHPETFLGMYQLWCRRE